jgi:AraC family transcriptional regulator
LQSALNYIHESLWQIETIAEISQKVGISIPYLFHLFKSILHTSPHQYIMQQKILEAERLIQKGVPATQIAKDCGFQSYSAFYKQYKKILGHNPTRSSYFTLSPINKSSPFD